jgi:hypothetical protein
MQRKSIRSGNLLPFGTEGFCGPAQERDEFPQTVNTHNLWPKETKSQPTPEIKFGF